MAARIATRIQRRRRFGLSLSHIFLLFLAYLHHLGFATILGFFFVVVDGNRCTREIVAGSLLNERVLFSGNIFVFPIQAQRRTMLCRGIVRHGTGIFSNLDPMELDSFLLCCFGFSGLVSKYPRAVCGSSHGNKVSRGLLCTPL